MTEDKIIKLLSRHYGDYLERKNVQIGFPGGFLNFGYWKGIDPRSGLSRESRLESQRDMYRTVLRSLNINSESFVLEVASGRGPGCVLALEEFEPAQVCGIDIMPKQIARAKISHAEYLREHSDVLNYRVGEATDIPYPNNTFDRVFSIEAILYFEDLHRFMQEVCRVMRTPGRFAVACVFATSTEVKSEDWLHLFDRSGLARGFAISEITDILSEYGFTDIQSERMGENVWFPYRQWVYHNFQIDNPMPNRWYRAYQDGLFDYYLVSADCPNY